MNAHKFSFFRSSRQIGLFVVMLASLGLLAFQAPAHVAAQMSKLEAGSLVNPDGSLNRTTGASGTVDLRGWNVMLDPRRGPVLSRADALAATPLDQGWSAMSGNGLNDQVYALAVLGSDLYVGGDFTQTVDGSVKQLNNIAKFDGAHWSALPHNGLNYSVCTLAVFGNDLYVGGSFTQTADGSVTNLNHIAKFDGTSWSPLSNEGLSNVVYTMAVLTPSGGGNAVLYVGGIFTATYDGSTNLNYIARYDGTTWSALPGGGMNLNGFVYALAVSTPSGGGGPILYVGGEFYTTNDSSVPNLFNIAKFDGTSWSALPNYGLNSDVIALAVSGDDVYVGGTFTETVDENLLNLKHIAKFDGSHWAALPGDGLNATVNTLAVLGSNLYVGGQFIGAADGSVTNLNHIAKFDGTNWSELPGHGLNYYVFVLAVWGSDLYVGGGFTQTVQGGIPNLNNIVELKNCSEKPDEPALLKPGNNKTITQLHVKLVWSYAPCATGYKVTVKNFATGKTAFKKTITSPLVSATKTTTLAPATYVWFVKACNAFGCAKSSKFTFTIQ